VLTRAHLANVTPPGRYRMHDLLRVYAAELVVAEDGEECRRAALTRLFDYYVATAAAAVAAVQPAEPRPPMPLTTRAEAVPPDPAAAQAWLDAERPTLLTVAGAAVREWPAHVAALATVLWRDLFFGGHQTEALTMHELAIRAARATGDRQAEAMTLVNLGPRRTGRSRCSGRSRCCTPRPRRTSSRSGPSPRC
jgi:hypothetical protein